MWERLLWIRSLSARTSKETQGLAVSNKALTQSGQDVQQKKGKIENAVASDENLNSEEIKCKSLLSRKKMFANLSSETGKMGAALYSIGVDESHIYFAIEYSNSSNLIYYIDIEGLMIERRQKGIASTGIDSEVLSPIASYAQITEVKPGEIKQLVLCYNLFTIKANQKVVFFVRETNGGRNVEFEISPKLMFNKKTVYKL
ncbi:MAG: conjugative transposon protein TraN [Prevotellaceae bacterium]|jgi:hypothetical protein|nr:conjugative transposon protein TraN [Prevotellaceae bacterium]